MEIIKIQRKLINFITFNSESEQRHVINKILSLLIKFGDISGKEENIIIRFNSIKCLPIEFKYINISYEDITILVKFGYAEVIEKIEILWDIGNGFINIKLKDINKFFDLLQEVNNEFKK